MIHGDARHANLPGGLANQVTKVPILYFFLARVLPASCLRLVKRWPLTTTFVSERLAVRLHIAPTNAEIRASRYRAPPYILMSLIPNIALCCVDIWAFAEGAP